MDIEKAFDSLDENFLISALESYDFRKNVIFWVKILLKDQESCVINSGTTTNFVCFSIRGLLYFYKQKLEIEGMTTFNYS